MADLGKPVERGVVRGRQGVQVSLGGGDARVLEAFLDDLKVGPAGEQPTSSRRSEPGRLLQGRRVGQHL
jgi:hypothetical protein